MDSHEEKLHNIIRKSKENEARDHMRRKAEAIDKENRAKAKLEKASSHGGNKLFSSTMNGNGQSQHFGGFGGEPAPEKDYSQQPAPEKPKKSRKKAQGMRLGKR